MWKSKLAKISQNVLSKQKIGTTVCRAYSGPLVEDSITHTGQKWDSDDYRMARFVDRPKHVNPNFSINLIAEVPPKACKENVVWCDGGSGPEGHPRVYINLDKPGNHSCGYCGLRFFHEDGGHHH